MEASEPQAPIAAASVMEISATEKATGSDTVRPISTIRLTVLYTSLCAGMFLSLLDTSIVATALYTIGSDFAALDRVTWVALAYTLAYLGCAVPFAALGDVIGRRNGYLLAFVLFLAFSLAAGWAQTLNQLIAFRTLQGIGGAGLYSLTMVIFPEITPPHRSQVIGALAGMVVAVAGVAGPVLGGVVTHYATWRWVFWLNGPIALLALIAFAFAWPAPDQLRGVRTRRRWRELDFVGSLLIIAASVLVVYAFQTAGIGSEPWGSAGFLAPLLTGCLCWVLLFVWQWAVDRWWRHRIAAVVPLHLLRRRVYVAGVVFTLLMGFPYFLIIYSLPLRFQVVNQTTPLLAGIYLLPLLGSAAVGSTLGGMLNAKKNRVGPTFVVAAAFLTLGTGLMTTFDLSPGVDAKTFGFEIFVGLGFGLAIATVSLSTLLEASLRDAAVAQGIVAQVRVFGGSLGIAASTAILGVTQRRELAGVVSPKELASLQTSHSMLTPAQLLAVQTSYADAFTLDLKVCAAISAVTILAAIATWRRGPAMDVIKWRQEQVRLEDERATEEKGAREKARGART